MKIAVLGTGQVGETIASKLVSLGHQVKMGSRTTNNEKAIAFVAKFSENASHGTFAESAAFGEIVFNCVSGENAIKALNLAGEINLSGKILIDVSNSLDFSKGQPATLIQVNTTSLGEEIQAQFPDLKVVKTLNTMWTGLMVNPKMVNNGDHTVFVSGNDSEAKEKVKEILMSFDWTLDNILDLGDITSARGPEMYLPLWLRIWGSINNGAFNIKIVR
jgi:8-hydroxy-5-deazaflavin:NADPH oxidoreductase